MWKIDQRRKEAVHDSGVKVVGISTFNVKGLYTAEGRTVELDMTYEGELDEVGCLVLNKAPYQWDDGSLLNRDEEALFRELFTEGILTLGFQWINYS